MSKLKNELTAIREALDTEHEYSGDYALQEEVANIRKLVENGAGSGGGSGVTVFPVIYGDDFNYVEVSETELLNALASGAVIFQLKHEENGVVTSITDYHVLSAYSGTAYSLLLANNNATVVSWSYTGGRYDEQN